MGIQAKERKWRNGSVPADNPFINPTGAMPEIYSYGHRNPQGTAFDLFNNRLGRIRYIIQSPDGYLYLLIDDDQVSIIKLATD